MRNPFRRSMDVPADVLAAAPLAKGERVLAATVTLDGRWLLGSRDAFMFDRTRVPWEGVQRADWDRDVERLVVAEVGEFGVTRPEHTFAVDEPGVMLELIRERVTASVVLQHRVTVSGKRGLFVIARRPPRGDGEITWAYEFDRGVDPADPAVMEAAERGLAAAEEQLGL